MATAHSASVTVFKHCSVSPPSPAATPEMSLPLTFLDMQWLHFPPVQRLVLYEVPQLSRAYFIENIIPKLEQSLSFTLKYFLSLVGNLIVPRNSNLGRPEIRYTSGNSVALIFAECTTTDFYYLIANHERNCCEFHPLIPELKPSFHDDSGSIAKTTPVLALQVTFFPNCGMSIGISNHHTVGDASSIFNFMKTWATLNSKFLEDIDSEEVGAALVSEYLPFYDRTTIKDTKGLGLIYWDQGNSLSLMNSKSSNTDSTTTLLTKTNKVRKTFVISRESVEKLKNLALMKRQKFVHLSSFTVICAYLWTCLIKIRGTSGDELDEEELEIFCIAADCRGRMDPPLPSNYFGNGLTSCLKTEKTARLIGEEGFPNAVELIGEAIHHRLKNAESLFDGAETWKKQLFSVPWGRVFGVAGSPRYNYYNLDFGWGKPIKFEFISIDTSGPVSLNMCRESDRDFEVGVSLPKPKMDAFTTSFNNGLNAL